MAIKVIAFDLFGTVFDLSSTPKDEIRDYIKQVRRPDWEELDLPDSWEFLENFPDSKEGLDRLARRYTLVTCSNAPVWLQRRMLQHNKLYCFSRLIDFTKVKAYKPDPKTYSLVFQDMEVEPQECLMITGNEGSPDLDAAESVGMKSFGIRKAGTKPEINLIHLAEILGC